MKVLPFSLASILLASCSPSGPADPGTSSANAPDSAAAASGEVSSNEADTAAGPASVNWTVQTKQSNVTGNSTVARLITDVPEGEYQKVIEISCNEKSKLFSVELVAASKEVDIAFQTDSASFLGVPLTFPKGQALTALSEQPVQASDFLSVRDYKNVAVFSMNSPAAMLGQNSELDLSDEFIRRLPLAVELDSSIGIVTYDIPNSELIHGVVENCVRSQEQKDQDRALAAQNEELREAEAHAQWKVKFAAEQKENARNAFSMNHYRDWLATHDEPTNDPIAQQEFDARRKEDLEQRLKEWEVQWDSKQAQETSQP